MCNIHQHEVLTDVMTRSGSSFIGSHGNDFMPINDLAWVGFSVEIGPGGASIRLRQRTGWQEVDPRLVVLAATPEGRVLWAANERALFVGLERLASGDLSHARMS